MPIIQQVIRLQVFINSKQNIFDVFTGKTPEAWKTTDIVFQIGFFKGTKKDPVIATAADLGDVAEVALKVFAEARTGAPYMDNSVLLADFDTTVTAETWSDGTAQHLSIPFSYTENNLPIPDGATEANFWLVIHGTSNTTPVRKPTFGGTVFKQIRDGVLDNDESSSPVQAGNLIPVGALYDVNGEYELAVTEGATYSWTKNANDTGVANGFENYSASAVFIAGGATITLSGTAGELITAVVRYDAYLTATQTDARYFFKGQINNNDLLLAPDKTILFAEDGALVPENHLDYSRLDATGFYRSSGGGEFAEGYLWSGAANGFLKAVLGLNLPFAAAGFITVAATGDVVHNSFDDLGIRFKDGQLQFWDPTAFAADNTKPWRAFGVDNGQTIWSDPILD